MLLGGGTLTASLVHGEAGGADGHPEMAVAGGGSIDGSQQFEGGGPAVASEPAAVAIVRSAFDADQSLSSPHVPPLHPVLLDSRLRWRDKAVLDVLLTL